MDQNRVSPFWIAWETDESFDVCLVLQLALLLHRIIHSGIFRCDIFRLPSQLIFRLAGDFSVLKVAIVDELLREEKSSSLIQLSADLIPSNPVVFVKICALYPNEAKKFYVSKSHFTGFNGFIAKTGYFLVICDALVIIYPNKVLDADLICLIPFAGG